MTGENTEKALSTESTLCSRRNSGAMSSTCQWCTRTFRFRCSCTQGPNQQGRSEYLYSAPCQLSGSVPSSRVWRRSTAALCSFSKLVSCTSPAKNHTLEGGLLRSQLGSRQLQSRAPFSSLITVLVVPAGSRGIIIRQVARANKHCCECRMNSSKLQRIHTPQCSTRCQ